MVDGSYASSDFRQDTKGTIGKGSVTVDGDANSDALSGVNRDVDAAQVVTKDKKSGFTVYADESAIREAVALAKGDSKNSQILSGINEISKDFDGNKDTASILITEFRQIGKELKQARALDRIQDDLKTGKIDEEQAVDLMVEQTAEFLGIDIEQETTATITALDEETGDEVEKTVTIDNREVVENLVLANLTSRAADNANNGELDHTDRLLVQEVARRVPPPETPAGATGTGLESTNDGIDEIVVYGIRNEDDQKLLNRANKGIVDKTAALVRPVTQTGGGAVQGTGTGLIKNAKDTGELIGDAAGYVGNIITFGTKFKTEKQRTESRVSGAIELGKQAIDDPLGTATALGEDFIDPFVQGSQQLRDGKRFDGTSTITEASSDLILNAATGGGKAIIGIIAKGKLNIPDANDIKGGAHRDTSKPRGDGFDSHHCPAKNCYKDAPISDADGPAIKIDPEDHRKTASNGNGAEALAYRAEQQRLLNEGKLEEAVQMDIDDIRSKFGNKYDDAIEQLQDYVKTLDPNDFKTPKSPQ